MIWHHLDRALDVVRRVTADDGSGGQVSVWAYTATVYALVSQPSAAERVTARQAGARHDHLVHLGPEADVRRGDRLRDAVTDPSTVDADARPYFDVLAVVRPSRPDVYLRAECELIQPEEAAWPV